MKKIISLIILLAVIFSFCSCGVIEYDEQEVKKEAEELIKSSVILDEIFWGKGISYVEDLNYANGSYYMASDLDLLKYGISTIRELEEWTLRTYSERYATSTLNSSLGTKNDGDFVYVLVRYYQKFNDAEQLEPECIMVNSRYEPLLTDELEYLYDTIQVISSDKEHIYITIDVNVTRGEKTQRKTLDISLVVEDGKYQIDTPTYTTYTLED